MLKKIGETTHSRLQRYFDTYRDLPMQTQASDDAGQKIDLPEAYDIILNKMWLVQTEGRKMMFIGNGGSAGIASHMAVDFCKNGRIRAQAFNDSSALTCFGNDYGYDFVFSKQLELHARPGDLLVAISSSGQSLNILNAVTVAKERQCHVVTLSGFSALNALRKMGHVNLYVPNSEYGFVEAIHHMLCQSVLSMWLGWDALELGFESSRPIAREKKFSAVSAKNNPTKTKTKRK